MKASRAENRSAVALSMARHLVAEGLGRTSVRQLAAAAGISDRMLLYYFDDKNDALTAALAVVAEQFAAGLSAAFDDRRQPARALLESVNALMLGDEVGSLMRLWLEIVAKSASREPPYPDVARSIANTFIDWIEAHLDTVGLADPRGTAAAILATVDGLAMLKLCAPDDVVARAARQAAASSMNSG